MNSRPSGVRQSVAHRAGHQPCRFLILPLELTFVRRETCLGRPKKKLPEQKISRVLFPPPLAGDDDHLSGSFVTKGFKRPTRKLSFAFNSGRVLRLRLRTSPSSEGSGRGGQPLTPILGLALRWGLPRPVLPRERVVSYTAFSPLPFSRQRRDRGGMFSVALSVPSG